MKLGGIQRKEMVSKGEWLKASMFDDTPTYIWHFTAQYVFIFSVALISQKYSEKEESMLREEDSGAERYQESHPNPAERNSRGIAACAGRWRPTENSNTQLQPATRRNYTSRNNDKTPLTLYKLPAKRGTHKAWWEKSETGNEFTEKLNSRKMMEVKIIITNSISRKNV